jgi:hypothetical protein
MIKGSKMSLEQKNRLSESHKGLYRSPETRKKLSESLKGHILSDETKKKISNAHKGKKLSIATRQKMSVIRKANREKNHLWKGGITAINQSIRTSLEYKLWRTAVFDRDNYTCIWCGQWGGKLQADHIKPFALFPELRFAIDNGRTLCVPCHKTTDTYARHLPRE